MEQQFARLLIRCNDKWRISSVNKNFEVCSSYPQMVIVPKGIGDDFLRISATFRDGGRFPVLCYYHHETKSCIVRCSQPLIGPTNRRCKEDETIINSLLSRSKGVIFDTRSKLASQSSKGKGGGSETQLFIPSGNILAELCNENGHSNWLGKLASCGCCNISLIQLLVLGLSLNAFIVQAKVVEKYLS
uniref:Myotubularin phosphatase domain-containing protein n=1 Tax=Ditylenchus dipsaci TaxID=166011 RepID=A0A915D9J4_9BILA